MVVFAKLAFATSAALALTTCCAFSPQESPSANPSFSPTGTREYDIEHVQGSANVAYSPDGASVDYDIEYFQGSANVAFSPVRASSIDYDIEYVQGSANVAFSPDRASNELLFNLKVSHSNLDELSLAVFDHATCKNHTFADYAITATAQTNDMTIEGSHAIVPVAVDVNTTDIGQYETRSDYPGFFMFDATSNKATIKFCVKADLGSAVGVIDQNGDPVSSSISYAKMKFQIDVNMEQGFDSAMSIVAEAAPSTLPSDTSSPPTAAPVKRPTNPPTRFPTKLPTHRPSAAPVPKPSALPTENPSNASTFPTTLPSPSPSEELFQTVTVTVHAQATFSGVSQNDLSVSFIAVFIDFQAITITSILGGGWGSSITFVGALERNLLEDHGRRLEDSAISFDYEITKVTDCMNDDGCGPEEIEASRQEGLNAVKTLQASVSSGEFTETIAVEAENAALNGLSDFSEVSVDELEAEDPTTEVRDPTAYPSEIVTLAPVVSPSPSSSKKPTVFPSATGTLAPVVSSSPSSSSVSPSFTQSASPTFLGCKDSPIKFEVYRKGNNIIKSCDWVKKKGHRCNLYGVLDHCPLTCGACNVCTDSALQLTFDRNDKLKSKNCNWVARMNTEERCAIDGMADTCRSTCGTCCSDNLEIFEFDFNGKTIKKSCDWVARKNTEARCRVTTVALNCPSTCNTCGCSNIEGKFRFRYKGRDLRKSCKWAERKDKYKRCKISTVASRCPLTCGNCGCTDTEGRIEFMYNGRTLRKKCEWAGRVDKATRCAIPFVAYNCQLTCASCKRTDGRYQISQIASSS